MTSALDETHYPSLESWVESANDPAIDFPIENLPFGRFRRAADMDWRIGFGECAGTVLPAQLRPGSES